MTDQERDALLLELRDTLRSHGARLERIEGKVDAISDQVQEVTRAVREYRRSKQTADSATTE